jgi:hypothetical protein
MPVAAVVCRVDGISKKKWRAAAELAAICGTDPGSPEGRFGVWLNRQHIGAWHAFWQATGYRWGRTGKVSLDGWLTVASTQFEAELTALKQGA